MRFTLQTAWYHGSPNGQLKEFAAKMTYFTQSPKVASMYAKRQVFNTAKTVGTKPTVYRCEVIVGKLLDLRVPSDQRDYLAAREEYNYKHKDPDGKLPHLKSEGFIMNTGLPSFGHVAAIFQAMPHVDSILVDDGSSGITLAVRDGLAQGKIVEKYSV